MVESAALVVWLRRQISEKVFLFTDIHQVAEFVKARPLVIIGFFQVLSSRVGVAFQWARSPVPGGAGRDGGEERLIPWVNSNSSFSNELVFWGNCRAKMKREKKLNGVGKADERGGQEWRD